MIFLYKFINRLQGCLSSFNLNIVQGLTNQQYIFQIMLQCIILEHRSKVLFNQSSSDASFRVPN